MRCALGGSREQLMWMCRAVLIVGLGGGCWVDHTYWAKSWEQWALWRMDFNLMRWAGSPRLCCDWCFGKAICSWARCFLLFFFLPTSPPPPLLLSCPFFPLLPHTFFLSISCPVMLISVPGCSSLLTFTLHLSQHVNVSPSPCLPGSLGCEFKARLLVCSLCWPVRGLWGRY